jgi:hypothetical protein
MNGSFLTQSLLALFAMCLFGCQDSEDKVVYQFAPGAGAGGTGGGVSGQQGGAGGVAAGNGGMMGTAGAAGQGPGAGGQSMGPGGAGGGQIPGAGGMSMGPGGSGGGNMGTGGGNMGTGGSAGGQMPMPGQGRLGDACGNNSDCASDLCIAEFPSGYCSAVCEDSDACGDMGSCWSLGEQSLCLKNCMGQADCRVNDGYVCDGDNTCYPGDNAPEPPAGMTPIGGPCDDGGECIGPNNQCIPQEGAEGPTGFVDGYCYQTDCSDDRPCPMGSECFTISEDGDTACFALCQ